METLKNMLDTSLVVLHANTAAKLTRTEPGEKFAEVLAEQNMIQNEILRRMAAK